MNNGWTEKIASLQAEANRTMRELCEERKNRIALEAELETAWKALREVQRLDKLTPKTDWIDIQAVVDDALRGSKKPFVTKEIIKAGVSRGVVVKDAENIDFGTGNWSIVIPVVMPPIKFYGDLAFVCPVCGYEARHGTNLDGPPENSPFCLECFRKANIPIMVLKGGKE